MFKPFFIFTDIDIFITHNKLFWQGPKHINSRVEAFLKIFESKLYEITPEEFKVSLTNL